MKNLCSPKIHRQTHQNHQKIHRLNTPEPSGSPKHHLAPLIKHTRTNTTRITAQTTRKLPPVCLTPLLNTTWLNQRSPATFLKSKIATLTKSWAKPLFSEVKRCHRNPPFSNLLTKLRAGFINSDLRFSCHCSFVLSCHRFWADLSMDLFLISHWPGDEDEECPSLFGSSLDWCQVRKEGERERCEGTE